MTLTATVLAMIDPNGTAASCAVRLPRKWQLACAERRTRVATEDGAAETPDRRGWRYPDRKSRTAHRNKEVAMLNKFIAYVRRVVSWSEALHLVAWILRNAAKVLAWLRKHPYVIVLRLVRAAA